MADSGVRTIGGCPGCRRSAVLSDGACRACSAKFGPEFGQLASRIRRDPGFRRTCYEALSTDLARAAFVTMFGEAVPPAMGSPNMCGGSA